MPVSTLRARRLADDRRCEGSRQGGGRAGGRRLVERPESGERVGAAECSAVWRFNAAQDPSRRRASARRRGVGSMPDSASADSRSETRRARNSASCSARATRPSSRRGGAAAPAPPRPSPPGPAAELRAGAPVLPLARWLLIESPVYRTVVRAGIFQLGLQLVQAARDAARDRAGRQVEGIADRPVALVAREESIEDVAGTALRAPGAPAGRREPAPRRRGSAGSATSTSLAGPSSRALRSRSMQQRRVSCPIQGRIAASSRNRSSRSCVFAKTSWNTSSAS